MNDLEIFPMVAISHGARMRPYQYCPKSEDHSVHFLQMLKFLSFMEYMTPHVCKSAIEPIPDDDEPGRLLR